MKPSPSHSSSQITQVSRKRTLSLSGEVEDKKPVVKMRELSPLCGLDRCNMTVGNTPSQRAMKANDSDLDHKEDDALSLSVRGPATVVNRPRTSIEVVVPTLQAVRRRQAAAAAARAHSPDAAAVSPVHARMDADSHEEMYASIKPEPEAEEGSRLENILHDTLQSMRNPEVKIKQEALLSDDFLQEALGWDAIAHRYPIPLPKALAEHKFHRHYIHSLYGGNQQDVFVTPSADKVAWHGVDDFSFLSLDYNPHAPTRPGYSGLYFSSSRAEEPEFARLRRVFVRTRKTPAEWMYMGQYRFEAGMSLTGEKWRQQKEKVRRSWAEGLRGQRWGESILLRVWFRREHGAGYEPTKEEASDAAGRIAAIRAQISAEDIIGAFDRGEEEMIMYRMICRGYDEAFVRLLERNAHRWVKALPKQSRKKRGR